MTLLAAVLASEATHPIIMPPLVFALIGFLVFFMLGLVTWTYRDVSNRQPHGRPGAGGHDSHGSGH